jgi:hypothetical protein
VQDRRFIENGVFYITVMTFRALSIQCGEFVFVFPPGMKLCPGHESRDKIYTDKIIARKESTVVVRVSGLMWSVNTDVIGGNEDLLCGYGAQHCSLCQCPLQQLSVIF